MNMIVYNDGETILREGEPGDCMYYILAGRVGVFLRCGTPEEKKLAELEEGQFFGEMGLLDGQPRSATVVSLEKDTCVQRIDRAGFGEFYAQYPDKVFDIMQQLSRRLRTANGAL